VAGSSPAAPRGFSFNLARDRATFQPVVSAQKKLSVWSGEIDRATGVYVEAFRSALAKALPWCPGASAGTIGSPGEICRATGFLFSPAAIVAATGGGAFRNATPPPVSFLSPLKKEKLMHDFKFNVGDEVVEAITGYKGVVTCRTQWNHNCNTYGVSSRDLKDGKPMDACHFDEPSLELLRPKVMPEKRDTGGPCKPVPQTNR
jgi:hypothetical protein